jgi:uncharacterized protein (TIGR00730 family)
MNRICVFCGSSKGNRQAFIDAAREMGAAVAERGLTLVYGAGNVGLMDVLANEVLDRGGEVIGVIPEKLVELEVVHTGLTECRVVGDMHERKALMAELSDGFIAMPGGIGTLEELFEALTWTQLGYHHKPCALLDAAGYYRHLIRFLEQAVEAGFFRAEHYANMKVSEDPREILTHFESCEVTSLDKWTL